jgi:CspA family cold shock protein
LVKQVAGGRVLQFDQARGYGFVAADDGGEDIFLHASVFDGDSAVLIPGVRVEFQVMAGDRGRKAFAAHLALDQSSPPDQPGPPGQSGPAGQQVPVRPPAAASAVNSAGSSPALSGPDDEQLCDVLSETEFRHALTELLLRIAPPLGGDQILATRDNMVDFARNHGWVDP